MPFLVISGNDLVIRVLDFPIRGPKFQLIRDCKVNSILYIS